MARRNSIRIVLPLLVVGSVWAQTPSYRLEQRTKRSVSVLKRYSPEQIALLEKLNRADAAHVDRLSVLVIPSSWDADELAYSPLPETYACCSGAAKFIVIHLPGQVFGAYEQGRLVRWGPVSSGGAHSVTPEGLYHLNWPTRGRASTVDPDWYMEWYFNFENRLGIALHAYTMPGRPASHGCIRLLERDAIWIYNWGESWRLAPDGVRVLQPGTALLITGSYRFDQPPPWRSLEWLSRRIELPPALPVAVSFVRRPLKPENEIYALFAGASAVVIRGGGVTRSPADLPVLSDWIACLPMALDMCASMPDTDRIHARATLAQDEIPCTMRAK